MANQRLTLQITTDTNIQLAIDELRRVLGEAGVENSELMQLLADSASRLRADLQSGSPGNTADTLIRGDGYIIRVTNHAPSAWSRSIDWMLGRRVIAR